MVAIGGNAPLLTDSDVESLAWQFLNSDYVSDVYGRWSLDRRLSTFLRRSGLIRVADDGDLFNVILDRVMTGISSVAGRATTSHASLRPIR
ncbi:hypothetical protein B586_16900 [Mycobacterium haemophilum DSM 44634]|uniref:Uncharacterized protein n=1 Tax=Mycobacterium haemophilum TaxID=29311 RepID=A0A0I9TYR5_9MYCO|nr:hypothetical protein B586_16900 [Mycobacterium haemophilum DSM 44634]KLO33745.1 hypothetical protein ABH39_01450 [Mycobacterium haemophilum]KLO39269.1 hypothetical protein ABH38_01455 [Mycobacterium haemophilum]KLO45579.1 hypothetical protein ABH37_01455 [Mycobacterium haemophilum]KLO56727.1 hypothetical protein ABH36_01450 [Mycobacterium haemophilum]